MPRSTARPAAFTLIEILLAMAIMAVICGTIYQFTGTTVRVASVATRVDRREQALGGLRRLLAAQLAALPASEAEALVGATVDGEHGRTDALQLLCPSGSPVLTPDTRGLYQVSFELRELPAGSGRHTIVLNREPWSDNADTAADQNSPFKLPAISAGGVRTSGGGGGDSLGSRPTGWVRLLDGVRSLQFDYFDPRLNTWVDKWNDPTMSPVLVRVRLGMEDGGAPYEFVERVPGGGSQRAALNAIISNAASPVIPGGTPPTAPPPGPVPTLPPGLRPPTAPPPTFNPGNFTVPPMR